jgi:eukaryotic-like serine/threonine-protein kinase
MAERTAGEPLPTLDVRTMSEASAGPSTLPRAFPEVEGYEILGVVREGGMGIVYKAWQVRAERPVALKMIKAGEKATPRNIARFHREAQAIAKLQHPNIVQLYDHDEAEGRPFFSMEFLEGGSLSDRFHDRPQPPRQASQLVQVLADAVHFCHQHGIVHRDLKPSNVLLTEAPGSKTSGSSQRLAKTANAAGTDASGSETFDVALWTPKLSDFGLVKQLGEDSGQTLTTDVIGTPSYMAPEQTPGTPGGNRNMGAVTDVYGLGAILYWALTGAPPFRGASVLDTLDQVRHKEPVAPSQLHLKVPLDLETICLKCLQKDPARRYSSAQALSKDLGNFLAGREIVARPVSRIERAWRWCRRNPGLAVAIAAAVVFLVAGSAGSLYWALQANTNAAVALRNLTAAEAATADAKAATVEAQAATRLSERRRYFSDIHLAYEAWKDGRIYLTKQRLDELRPKAPADVELQGFEWHYLNRLCQLDLRTLSGHKSNVLSVAFSHDGVLVASAGEDGWVKIWESATGRELRSLAHEASSYTRLAFSPKQHLLAVPSADRTVKLWNADSGELVHSCAGHVNRVNAVAFSPDGKQMASGSVDRTIRFWEIASGHEVLCLHTHASSVRSVAFSPRGNLIASTYADGTIHLWDPKLGKETAQVGDDGARATSAAFSPDGVLLATGTSDHFVRIWDASTQQVKQTLNAHTEAVEDVAFSPDGARIVSAGKDAIVRIWAAHSGEQMLTLRGHEVNINSVATSPDGRRVATASTDGTVKLWDSISVEEAVSLRGHTSFPAKGVGLWQTSVSKVQFSPNGEWLASASEDQTVRIWRTSTGQLKWSLVGHSAAVWSIAFSPDSALLASASADRTVKIWDVQTGRERQTLTGHGDAVCAVAFHPDGHYLASGSKDKTVGLWDLVHGGNPQMLRAHKGEVMTVAYSRDGRRLASGSLDGTAKIWDTATNLETCELPVGHPVRSVALSTEGERVATASDDQVLRVWDATGVQAPLELRGHTCQPTSVEFGSDGTRLVSASACDFTVRVWDTVTGQEFISLLCTAGIQHAVLSPDGALLAGAAADGTVKIWDARPITAEYRVQREARGLVTFLFGKHLSEADVSSRIIADATITDEVRKSALAIAGPYGRTLTETESHRLIQVLLAKPMSREEAIESVQADKTIWEPVRQRALILLPEYPEDAQALFSASQATVRNAGGDEHQYARALKQARAVNRLRPDDPWSSLLLAMARYRVREFQDAIVLLTEFERLHLLDRMKECDRTYTTVVQLAFLAMAQHRSGRLADAKKAHERLREAMKQPMPQGQDQLAARIFRETEQVLRTPIATNIRPK